MVNKDVYITNQPHASEHQSPQTSHKDCIVSDINLELFVRTSDRSKPYRLEQHKTLRQMSEKISPNLILW